ncbi:uncharacterized protein RCC_02340 [Ramularia collo-cygni]|uniref:Alpha-1,2-mannosyltransferase n=1 Tax=Ramularia collo-cygni TaxID=112498 RepID=A0A2D3UWB8_9PEZI|nr:uncharacterized protein RCC_02340 [Ramularia collo-cygni]CZT16497.1 uncharacterized protein RCC_02340 [Ramularia collo-cygni]
MLDIIILPSLIVVGFVLHLILKRTEIGRHWLLPRLSPTSDATKSKSSSTSLKYERPPSRRHALPGCSSYDARSTTKQDFRHDQPLPDKQSVNPAIHQDCFTPTGITRREIQQLRDFPDYAGLSGVPLPDPCLEFDITKAMARPYRPFRWVYHQTMSLQKLDPNWWLELDRNYIETVRLRKELFEKQGSDVLQVLPGSELAAKELMEMCLQFLCARYPHYFQLSECNTIFHNLILQTQTHLPSTSPFDVLLENIPEDFAIMLRDPSTGSYTFRAGIIMSSLGWTLGSKIGKRLDEVHGPVPDYKARMSASMDRFFAKMPTDKPIQRGSWGIEVGKPLFMPAGPEREGLKAKQKLDRGIEDMHLRVDWQTLRRLPLSGAVVFNFKALFTPVEEFKDEAYVPTLLLKVLREGKESLMEYKRNWCTEHVVVPALEEYEREQIDRGIMEEEWEPCTLEENPFFPGWREKWHRQQGFV